MKIPESLQKIRPALSISLVVVISIISFLDIRMTMMWYSKAAYYIMWLLVILWGTSLVKLARSQSWNFLEWLRSHRIAIVVGILLTAAIGIAVPATFRILSDEANVMAVSRTMVFEKRADNVTQGYRFYLNFFSEANNRGYIEKHGLLFPFTTHIIHSITGYRVENAYAFNLIVFFLILIICYSLIQSRCGPFWGIGSMIMVASVPIIPLVARSAGVDLLAALVLLIFLIALKNHSSKQSDESGIFLLTTFALLMHSRQEYALVGILGIGTLWFCKRILIIPYLKHSFPVHLLAFTSLPIIWQRLAVKDPFENSDTEVAFSIAHFINNNAKFFKQAVSIDFFIPLAAPITLLGLAGLIMLAFRFVSQIRQNKGQFFSDSNTVGWLAVTVSVLTEWVIITSYFRGIPTHPSDTRYFVQFCVILCLLAVFFLAFRIKSKKFAPIAIPLIFFILYLPIASDGRFINSQLAVRYHKFTIDYFKKHAPVNSLIISTRPGHYAVYGYGAVGMHWANTHYENILKMLKRHAISEIFVIQKISPETFDPFDDEALNPEYILEPVALLQNTPKQIIRISRVLNHKKPSSSSNSGFQTIVSPFPGISGNVDIPMTTPPKFNILSDGPPGPPKSNVPRPPAIPELPTPE